jgi:putative DNA-invertase from lambdoid prophage Rac
MRIALYARVSKAIEQNPENQLIELRRWANASGNIIEGEYVDEISSKDTRPNKELVLRKIRLSEVDGVAFYALDRWGRTMSELVLELEEFSKSGKAMISIKEGLDLSNAAGRLMANVLAAMANFERDRIRERTLLGLARARAQGKKLGRPLKNGATYCKPSRAEIQECLTKGLSIREMATKLNTSKYWIEVTLKELKKEGCLINVSLK